MKNGVKLGPDRFIKKTVEEYRKARLPVYKNRRVSRGRSHSVSSVLEDLFALYLVQNIKDIEVLIDQPFNVEGKQFYPDIAVLRRGELINMFDLKTDIGWGREKLLDLQKHHIDIISRIKGLNAKYKSGTNKEKKVVKISKAVTYDIVILNSRNSGKNLATHLINAEKMSIYVRIFVLCKSNKYHTNQYSISKKELIDKLEINEEAFKDILIRIK